MRVSACKGREGGKEGGRRLSAAAVRSPDSRLSGGSVGLSLLNPPSLFTPSVRPSPVNRPPAAAV